MSTNHDKPIQRVPLKNLLLDTNNPRFGVERGERANQKDILDFIVENFGISDVINSLAYNGYFEAEPLIARDNEDGTFTVVEGNRRLSACLILAGSERAKNQLKIRSSVHKTSGWSEETTELPVQVYKKGEDTLKLHAYLGVRHIMSAKAWDSYSKATWIHDVISDGQMTLEQICEVTGDKNRTIKRLLEGYYVINQLKNQGLFKPENSLRKGRGSNPEFPFSWVYTLIDYSPVRREMGLDEFQPKNQNPIKKDKEVSASKILTYMFGDKSKGLPPAINDSRQLGALANAIDDSQKREMLSSGKTVDQIEELTKPPIDQFSHALIEVKENLSLALSIVSAGQLSSQETEELLPRTKEVANLSATLYKAIRDSTEPEQF